jgi:hypothetical protein
MGSHLHINWTPRDAGGFQADIPDLGLVEIHPDKGPNKNSRRIAFDINSVRAFTFTTGNIESVKLSVNRDLRSWHYLNGFKKDPT